MADQNATEAVVAVPEKAKAKPKTDNRPKQLPPYNVVLLDDNAHSYEYVIVMLRQLFGHPTPTAFRMACEVDTAGRVVVDTTSKERAEFKRDQIHAYGADSLIAHCKGSMSAIIEPCLD